MLADLIKKYLWWGIALAFMAVVAIAGMQTIRLAESKAANATQKSAFETARRLQADKLAVAEKKARDVEYTMNQNVAKITKEKTDELAKNTASYERVIRGLQNRARRPSPVASGGPSPTVTCERGTGAGLYREDGEFLAGEAAESNRRKIALAACYKQYDEVEEMFKKLRESQ